MTDKRLVVLAGDGIGPEVTEAALQVLDEVRRQAGFSVEIVHGLLGGVAIDAAGSPFPEATRNLVDAGDPVLLGAVGGPKWETGTVRPEQGLLAIRKHMGLWANLRPFEVFPGLEDWSPLRRPNARGIVIRELTGGLYFGEPRLRRQIDGEWEAVDTLSYRQSEIARIARLGFETARRKGTPLVSVDKANILESSRLWRETVEEICKEFPDVAVVHRYVDAAAMEMVARPELYQVVVTENLFGDILSDLAGGLVGSLGLLGSASVRGPVGTPGLYEPVHGSAPDIAGRGVANPVGAILSLAMLTGWSWNEPELEAQIVSAVRRTLRDGRRTRDLGGDLTTAQFTEAVIEAIKGGEER
ncbi:MAG: 3-isopropylmalate dehydrogenase [Thermaerobacter sp.]|nr:3-isopropylmalate dehydrogenase [Thermaerobacter sp.]